MNESDTGKLRSASTGTSTRKQGRPSGRPFFVHLLENDSWSHQLTVSEGVSEAIHFTIIIHCYDYVLG